MRFAFEIFAFSLSFGLIRSLNCDQPEDFFCTSLPGLQRMLNIERKLLLNLENYANALEAKFKLIQRAIEEMRAENLKSVDDDETYLSNALNSFALIRRMYTDWKHWELYMRRPVGETEISLIKKLRINLPSSEDMNKATDAINRLQVTYNLDTIEMAAGLLKGKQYNASLSSRDCFEVGQRLLSQEKLFYSSFWLYTAIVRYEENEVNAILGFDKLQIYDLYMKTFLKQNRLDKALEVANIALSYNPNNAEFLHAKSQIEQKMKTSKEEPMKSIEYESELNTRYYHCCRGEFDKRLTRLHCLYNTTTHPFLKLAPLKMEELLMDPYIVLFHDVISDAEIAEIKAITLPYLKPAVVYFRENEEIVADNRKTSYECSFADNASNTTKRIMQRISHLSGFELQGSKEMHVNNYVLAAHHEPHYDFFNVSEDFKIVQGIGDRIATLIFYLSDVDQGGSTVFPYLDIAVHPRKGSALMWYNLNNRGEVDGRTMHASCPVIVGSKWIGIKWIRVRPQMFRRPCYA